MGSWSAVTNAVCSCTLLQATVQSDQVAMYNFDSAVPG